MTFEGRSRRSRAFFISLLGAGVRRITTACAVAARTGRRERITRPSPTFAPDRGTDPNVVAALLEEVKREDARSSAYEESRAHAVRGPRTAAATR